MASTETEQPGIVARAKALGGFEHYRQLRQAVLHNCDCGFVGRPTAISPGPYTAPDVLICSAHRLLEGIIMGDRIIINRLGYGKSLAERSGQGNLGQLENSPSFIPPVFTNEELADLEARRERDTLKFLATREAFVRRRLGLESSHEFVSFDKTPISDADNQNWAKVLAVNCTCQGDERNCPAHQMGTDNFVLAHLLFLKHDPNFLRQAEGFLDPDSAGE